MKSMVEISHSFLMPAIHRQAVCLDGTLGTGQDTSFFLNRHARKTIAFEIQPEAAAKAKTIIEQKTKKNPDTGHLTIVLDSHEHVDKYIHEEIDAAIFNFGYCPSGNTAITTQPETSLQAVQKTLRLLKPKGRMALVFYPHAKGREEGEKIEGWLKTLDHRAVPVQKIQMLQTENAPWCLLVEKRKRDAD